MGPVPVISVGQSRRNADAGASPAELRPAFIVHNLLLSFGSLWLLALLVEQIAPIIYHHGFFYSICDKGAWTRPIVTLYIVNY